LLAQIRRRASDDKPPLTKGEAAELLQASGLTRAAAREVVTGGTPGLWLLTPGTNPNGKGTVISLVLPVAPTPTDQRLL
jgi:hypothetical protein